MTGANVESVERIDLRHIRRAFGHRLAIKFLMARMFIREKRPLRSPVPLIFVCKGNICRSVYAEAYARSVGLEASSAGLDAAPGRGADPTAIAIAARRGIDLNDHRTRRLNDQTSHRPSLFLALEPSLARRAVQQLSPDENVGCLGSLGSEKAPLIPDPYGLGGEAFHLAFDLIEHHVDALVEDWAASRSPGS
ncbi:MAG: low molecular weight phosphatase family protein [Pacificimonas sp.]